MRRLSFVLRTLLMTFFLGSVAATASARPPTPAEVEQARTLFAAGVEAANKSDWPKAYELLAEAWKLKQHPQVAANFGRAALKVRRPGVAAEMFYYFLRESPEASAEDKKAVEIMLAEARTGAAAVVVDVSEPGAQVLVDDLPMGVSPLAGSIYMDYGPRVVSARTDADKEVRKTVEVKRNAETVVTLDLPDRVAAKEKPKERRPEKSEETGGSPDKVVVGVGAGLFVVGVGLGIAGIVVSDGASGDLDTLATQSTRTSAKWDEINKTRTTWANVAGYSFIGAGVAGLATVGYLLIPDWEPDHGKDAATTAVNLSVTPDRSEVVLTGRW